MKRPDIIQGGRAELERELLEAMFTPGAEPLADTLKVRLARRGYRKLRLVPDDTCKSPPETGGNPTGSGKAGGF
jgi:hypothetical protein